MAFFIKQPTANQTPDATLGGLAVTGITNTGHAATSTSSSATGLAPSGADSDSDTKSARWFGLSNVGGQRTSVRLKFSWAASGDASASGGTGGADPQIDGAASSVCNVTIQYSINGGGGWITVVNDGAGASSSGGIPESDNFTNNNSADIALSISQDVSLIQVRALYTTQANATAGNGVENATADASMSVTVSAIQVEVTTVDTNLIVLM